MLMISRQPMGTILIRMTPARLRALAGRIERMGLPYLDGLIGAGGVSETGNQRIGLKLPPELEIIRPEVLYRTRSA